MASAHPGKLFFLAYRKVSVLDQLLFLIYINDLLYGFNSICKIFTDNTFIFSKIFDKDKCQEISIMIYPQQVNGHSSEKCSLIQIPINKLMKFIFLRKLANADDYIPISRNDSPLQLCESQKHLHVILEKHLSFHEHIERKIEHLSVHPPRKSLLTIYKSFVRPHLDDGDIIYDNPANKSLINKLEKVQYQACLAITGSIQGTSRESAYKELGLESLQSRRWYGKIIFFYKVLNGPTPKYLFDIILVSNDSCYNTRAQSKSKLTQFLYQNKKLQ